MVQLTPISLEDGTIIYIESTEDVNMQQIKDKDDDTETERVAKGLIMPDSQARIFKNFQAIESTIRSYTHYSLNAFKKIAIANIDKVTLEFGIKVGGEAGIPYVTKGLAESNLKITVECSFPIE